MTLAQDHSRRLSATSAVIWSARALLAVVCGYLLLLTWPAGDTSFLPAGVLLAVVASSFRWPDVAPLSVMLLSGLGLLALAVTWMGYGTASVDVGLIESDIESGLRDQTGEAVDVTCPRIAERIDATAEGVFSCDLIRLDGTKDRVTVSVQGGGGVRWWRIG